MGLIDAFEIVLSLARQNMANEADMPEECARQKEACDMLEDFAVNYLGDDNWAV